MYTVWPRDLWALALLRYGGLGDAGSNNRLYDDVEKGSGRGENLVSLVVKCSVVCSVVQLTADLRHCRDQLS